MNKKIYEIIFYARAGQGAKSASEILAQATMKEGKNVQTFPYYGPQRSGAPTKVYVKISESEIRSHEPIKKPDLFVIMDETLLETDYAKDKFEKSDAILINTRKSFEDVKKIINDEKIYLIDANKVAKEIIGKEVPNGVILGSVGKISKIVQLDKIIKEFNEVFIGKISEDLINKNILAIKKGFEI